MKKHLRLQHDKHVKDSWHEQHSLVCLDGVYDTTNSIVWLERRNDPVKSVHKKRDVKQVGGNQYPLIFSMR